MRGLLNKLIYNVPVKKQESHTVIVQVQHTIQGHDLFGGSGYPTSPLVLGESGCLTSPLVLMVSGGSDSVALVYLMALLFPDSTDMFTILHVNHLLRAEDADKDEDFVRSLAASLGIRYEVRREDIAALAASLAEKPGPVRRVESISKENGSKKPFTRTGNIEQLGREVRYRLAHELLDQLCDEAQSARADGRIITAHTLDDRAETFFMRSTVGAGASGLRSIPYRNGRVIRPLLDCTRTDLQNWLVEQGVSWREDTTNSDTRYLRAFMRHEVLPLLSERNPEVLGALQRTMNILSAEDDYLSQQAQIFEEQFITRDQNTLLISAELLTKPLPLVRRVVYTACSQAMPPEERVTFEHIETIVTQGATPGFAIMLPGKVEVRNEYGILRIIGTKDDGDEEKTVSVCLQGIECTLIDTRDLDTDPVTYARAHFTTTTIFADADSVLAGNMYLDHIHKGDRFCPIGMDGSHKLVSDILIDRKVPMRLRSRIPILRTSELAENTDPEGQIVWIIGVMQDDRYKVTGKTTKMVRITYTGDVCW